MVYKCVGLDTNLLPNEVLEEFLLRWVAIMYLSPRQWVSLLFAAVLNVL